MVTRTCKKCGSELPEDEDHFEAYLVSGKRGLRYRCHDCAKEYTRTKMKRLRRGWRLENPLPVIDVFEDGVKKRICDECKNAKPLNAGYFRKFHRAGKAKPEYPDYFSRKCLHCLFGLGTEDGRAHYAKLMLDNARSRAKRDNLPCTITVGDIIIPEFCPVFKTLKLTIGNRHMHDASPTLDKLIPVLGYVPGNVQVISHKANRLKSDGSLAELIAMRGHLKEVIEYVKSRTEKSP